MPDGSDAGIHLLLLRSRFCCTPAAPIERLGASTCPAVCARALPCALNAMTSLLLLRAAHSELLQADPAGAAAWATCSCAVPHTNTLGHWRLHTPASGGPLRAAGLPCCRLIGEDVWPVTAGLSRGLWQVGNKICQTLNLDCNLTVTVTPQGTVSELGLQEGAHTESECSGQAVVGREQHACSGSHGALV